MSQLHAGDDPPTLVRRTGGRRIRPLMIGAALVSSLLLLFSIGAGAPAATGSATPTWGVYSGPGDKGVQGAAAFAATSKIRIGHVLDFLPDQSWAEMTKATWLIDAYRGRAYQLELSVPMLPRTGTASLGACAAGDYNSVWRTIAGQLAAAGLGDTVVRPGWEMNGNWYRWSAVGQTSAYVGCFRQLVTSMRAISPKLKFDWTVNAGDNKLDATLAFPGSAYVDYVGVDIYDYDYRHYATPTGATTAAARSNSWNYALTGRRGLDFWAGFARQQHKPLVISEWALAWRSDGKAGGDDSTFVRGIVGFATGLSNNVSWATYFNSPDTATVRHNLTVPGTAFPAGRDTFFALAKS